MAITHTRLSNTKRTRHCRPAEKSGRRLSQLTVPPLSATWNSQSGSRSSLSGPAEMFGGVYARTI